MAQWDQYFAQWEGKPGSMLVKMDLMDQAPKAEYPFLIAVGVQYDDCNKEGMPSNLIYNQLTSLSDKLESYISIQYDALLVGTFTHDCSRVDYFYASDTLTVSEFLTTFFKTNGTDFVPLISMTRDDEWRYYKDVIYPDDYLMEYMMNRRLIEELVAKGDDITKARRIDHWAYFQSDVERDQYRIIVLERGFKEESQGKLNVEERPYFYHFSRRDKPEIDYISELTNKLQLEASKLGGYYDGWECEAIKKKQP
jgi:uncharacterized protein (TIGR01619 family)